MRAAGAILDYLLETQRTSLDHFDRLVPYRVGQFLEIDESTRRSLEITRTLRDGRREGSLLAVIDRTTNAMGSRLLADWVAAPLTQRDAIDARLDAVEELVRESRLRAEPARRTERDLRYRAVVVPRRHRPGQPARSEFHRAHAGQPAGRQATAGRPHQRLAAPAGSGPRSVRGPARPDRRGAGRRVPADGQARAASFAPASTPSWTASANWRPAESSGLPSTRRGKSNGPASPN